MFSNSVKGFVKIMKSKTKLTNDMIALAAEKAFISIDITQRGEITMEEVRLWISFNIDFEFFLNEFSNIRATDSNVVEAGVFKQFMYEMELEYFEKRPLNTQKIKMNISRSLSLNYRKNNKEQPDNKLIWKYAKEVKPSDKFVVRKAKEILMRNHVKFDYSSESENEASYESLKKDPIIKKFIIKGCGMNSYFIYRVYD